MDGNSVSGTSQASSQARNSASHQMTLLPEGFAPGDCDVICGRGKKCYNHKGNERFRVRVNDMLAKYVSADSKLAKSGVLSELVDHVRRESPDGGFVKQDNNGRWYEVGDFLAREKTSQAFRDALDGRYKSSNFSKKKRRQEEQAKAAKKHQLLARSDFELSAGLGFSSDIMNNPADNRSSDLFNHANLERMRQLSGLPRSGFANNGRRFAGNSSSFRGSHRDGLKGYTFPDPLFGPNSMGTRDNSSPAFSESSRASPALHHERRAPQRAHSSNESSGSFRLPARSYSSAECSSGYGVPEESPSSDDHLGSLRMPPRRTVSSSGSTMPIRRVPQRSLSGSQALRMPQRSYSGSDNGMGYPVPHGSISSSSGPAFRMPPQRSHSSQESGPAFRMPPQRSVSERATAFRVPMRSSSSSTVGTNATSTTNLEEVSEVDELRHPGMDMMHPDDEDHSHKPSEVSFSSDFDEMHHSLPNLSERFGQFGMQDSDMEPLPMLERRPPVGLFSPQQGLKRSTSISAAPHMSHPGMDDELEEMDEMPPVDDDLMDEAIADPFEPLPLQEKKEERPGRFSPIDSESLDFVLELDGEESPIDGEPVYLDKD